MPWRQWFRRKTISRQIGHTSTPNNPKRQDDRDGQANTSTVSDVSPTQPLHAPAINKSQPDLASRPQQCPAPANLSPPPLLDHLPSTEAAASTDTGNIPASLPERLWDRAYDGLKVNEAALVRAYEKILSRKLRGQACDSPGSESEQNIIVQDDTDARRKQMRQLIHDGLDKTAREAKVKGSIGTAMEVVLSAKSIISSAVQTVPQAALAWTGVCVALEMFENPVTATKANRNGIKYVIKRMDWYWELSSVVLKEDEINESGLSGVRRELETQIVDLYKALLSYEIKSVCSYYRHRGLVFLRDIVQLDDWDGSLKSIQNAEGVFRDDSNAYMGQKMTSNLEKLVTHAETQHTTQMTEKDDQCLEDLRLTDPHDDKKRIEQTKGGLLQECYRWILDNPDFQQWLDNEENRLLWIRGDPGKGKTMLLCGIIDELSKPSTHSGLVSYFFCQATDQRINNATAVLRGLIFMLVDQQPSLISHVRKKYDHAGKELFKDANAWIALSNIFADILRDPALTDTYLIIDALDECTSGLTELLDLVVRNLSASPHVKWILSSRNWPEIERQLAVSDGTGAASLSLEVNADLVSRAVDSYIRHKVSQLASTFHDKGLQDQVHHQMRQKANGTFLWVALVFKELKDMEYAEYEDASDILSILEKIPSDLTELYSRMLQQISRLKSNDPKLCRTVLSTAALAYRPLSLLELSILAGFKGYLTDRHKVERLVNKCGSFLTIRDGTVYFVHQSAKDHLITNEATRSTIFPSGREDVHHTIFSRSLQAMTKTLQSNIYALPDPGFLVGDISTPDPDPLAAIRYSCVHWASHLCEGNSEGNSDDSSTLHRNDLDDHGAVSSFLQEHFLHWLEALSLLRNVSDGVISITRLESLLRAQSSKGQLFSLLQDARRFILHSKVAIEIAPLQTYSSALIFSPMQSLIRKIFHQDIPLWMLNRPIIEDNWSPCVQTLEGHSDLVTSVAFSADGKQVASGSDDQTVKIWDTARGACVQTLKGHSGAVASVAFSADGKQVASGSYDGTVKIWDTATGACVQTLEGHSGEVASVAFSADGKQVASGSDDRTVKVWDTATSACVQTLEVGIATQLSFDKRSNSRLYTNLGALDLDLASSIDVPLTETSLQPASRYGYGIDSTSIWIVKDGKPMLWLPPAYRPATSVIAESMMAIGCRSGRVWVMQFSE